MFCNLFLEILRIKVFCGHLSSMIVFEKLEIEVYGFIGGTGLNLAYTSILISLSSFLKGMALSIL